jgi:DNA mismatch repair ATPase MutL
MLRNEKKQKYPIFILNLTCPYAIYDITLDPKKTQIEFKNWSVIVQTFEEAVKQFLGQHRLERPPENQKKSDELMIENRDARNSALNGHSPKLGLWKTVSGAISKRQFSNQNIVKEVLQNSQHDDFENG